MFFDILDILGEISDDMLLSALDGNVDLAGFDLLSSTIEDLPGQPEPENNADTFDAAPSPEFCVNPQEVHSVCSPDSTTTFPVTSGSFPVTSGPIQVIQQPRISITTTGSTDTTSAPTIRQLLTTSHVQDLRDAHGGSGGPQRIILQPLQSNNILLQNSQPIILQPAPTTLPRYFKFCR